MSGRGRGTRAERKLVGPDAIRAAVARDEPIALALVREDVEVPEVRALVADLEGRGVAVSRESVRSMRRMSEGEPPADLIALAGRPPTRDLAELMSEDGLVLVLVGLRYPGNVGFILRSAEVAGVTGVVLCTAWSGDELEEARRVAMGADRFLPVIEAPLDSVFAECTAAARRVVALETTGHSTARSVDWAGRVTLFVGGEADGLPPSVLEAAETIVRIPVRGFVPSYNVQAAVGIVLGELLRDVE